MIGKMAPDQGRARGLYDEQLQRKQQEKALIRAKAGERPAFFAAPLPTAAAGEAR
jgi:hypothetical protein